MTAVQTGLDAPNPGLARSVRRGALYSSLNNILVRLAGMGVNIILARLLAPEQFGVFAVAITVHAILSAVADLGMAAGLVRNGDFDRRGPTTATLGLMAGVSLALLMAVSAGPVAATMGAPEAASVVRVMSASLVMSSLCVVPYAVLQRNFLQGRQLALDAGSLVVGSIITILLVQQGWGAMSLAVGRVSAQALATAAIFIAAGVAPRFGWDRQLVRGLLSFGLPIAGANLLSWVVIGLDNIIVGHSLGAVSLGLYVMAFNISSWPMIALGQVIRSVAFPAFARLAEDPERASDALQRACLVAWMLAVPMTGLLAVLADPLINVLYGDRWAAAAAALVGLASFGALRVVFDVLASMLFALGRSRTVLYVQIAWLVTLLPTMLISIAGWGLAGAAWAHLVVAGGVVLPLYLVALKDAGLRSAVVLRSGSMPVLFGLAGAAAAMLCSARVTSSWAELGAGTAAFLLVYVPSMLVWLQRCAMLHFILPRRAPERASVVATRP